MIPRRSLVCVLAVVASAIAAQTKPTPVGQAKTRVKAADAFAQIQAGARKPDAAQLERAFPADLVSKRAGFDQGKVEAWRAAFAKEAAAAKILTVREQADEATVRFNTPGSTDERELPLRYAGEHWLVDAAQSYLVKGKSLDSRRGKDVVRTTLQARTDNEGYGKSAFSFTHVTSDADQCKNRMDVWYCHNGDLHVVGDNRVADLGNQKLAMIDSLPPSKAWAATGEEIAPKKGRAYVVHCRQNDRRDFYVKLSVVDVSASAVTIEWTLLTDGWNAPASLATPQPLVSNDGADGADGLCGKRCP